MSVDDDGVFVREQYETEANLAARKSVWAASKTEGPDPRELAFGAIAEAEPRRVLEVGGGEGELALRIMRELGRELVGVDQSPRMVEIQRAKGIDARVGDVQQLPFADAEFDVAVAAWMLYHVTDVDRALSELARVLRSEGRLVVVVNGIDHLRELWELAGRDTAVRDSTFRTEIGEEILGRHFPAVDRRDANGWVTLDDDAIRMYAASWDAMAPAVDALPLERPLRTRRATTIFVALKQS